jgi:VIT1/CCC1 family predicted Fe2+/Mn2+ transporter
MKKINNSIKTGLFFGLTSATITTSALIVGLYASVGSRLAIFGGIITIAIADSFSDALGIHVSEESKTKNHNDVWRATIFTFATKLIFALTFIVPFLFFEMKLGIILSLLWGLCILVVSSYVVAKKEKEKVWARIYEHVLIGIVAVILSYYVGEWVNKYFN